MAKQKDHVLQMNQKMVSLSDFLVSYNRSIPSSYPQATPEDLKQFEVIYARLFKKIGEWSLEKHRKRLMDWLPVHRNRQQR